MDTTEKCFFITPIDEEGSDTRTRSDGVLQYIVAKAAEELGLVAVRADQIADPGQINLQVIDHVLKAKAAVADLTGLNANVFYEMAVRHTAKLPLVIIAEKDTDLPFDIAQMRTIFFDHKSLQSADECRQNIVAQLRQALENGVVDSPIATALDVSALASGSAIERTVADLVTTVEDVAKGQRDLRDFMVHDSRGAGRGVAQAALRDLAAGMDKLHKLQSAREDDGGLREALRKLDPASDHILDRLNYQPSYSKRRPLFDVEDENSDLKRKLSLDLDDLEPGNDH